MTYALEADIVEELKGVTFSATSQVTTDAVADFLNQADAVIDMYVGKRYATPLTAAAALLVVKKIAIDIVVYRITKILNLKKSVPVPDSNIPQDITEGSAYRESMKMLTAIRDNKLDLPDETEIDTSGGLGSFHTETGNEDLTPCFQKGVDQW
jgi:phage gp36-like protein